MSHLVFKNSYRTRLILFLETHAWPGQAVWCGNCFLPLETRVPEQMRKEGTNGVNGAH